MKCEFVNAELNFLLIENNYNNMTQITTQSIVDTLNSIELMKANLNLQLLNKQEELKSLDLYKEIKDLEISIKQLEKQDEEIREQGKQILLSNWLKKFEALDWTIIQLNKTPGALVIENEDLVPKEYKKEKVTISIDKKALKEDIKQGLIIEWVSIEEDYNLVIKNPK